MGGHQANVAEQGARRVTCGRSTRPQRHLPGAAIRRAMARSAGLLWSMHHLLQPLRSVAKGRSMGANHGRTCLRSRWAVQMIDTSIVRVHQHAACIARNRGQSIGQSRGGLTSKIHAVVDTNGLPVRLGLTAGEAHDNRNAPPIGVNWLAGRCISSRTMSELLFLHVRGKRPHLLKIANELSGRWRVCRGSDPRHLRLTMDRLLDRHMWGATPCIKDRPHRKVRPTQHQAGPTNRRTFYGGDLN